ncbi:hypothetical protein PQ460_21035 [Paenibacillus sp. KACC 21273]|uniref:hypothetical protein n=1 Tax=Paenibacillus sp. KACC 21273 TaxID=3025665 RepID=UPI0023659DD8|nr:hypothetical protein [Paenibacillus sp. KACC 21273]WDF50426.1 hypothetical protein PQ460_21035 [Paenibacillus sp. KACC 21273]
MSEEELYGHFILSYDEGKYAEIKRMAVVLRTILHNINKSTSLFKYINLIGKVNFYDTCNDYDSGNLMP